MELRMATAADYPQLYEFYRDARKDCPYWFDADTSLWQQCFTDDIDYDGNRMFRCLHTCIAWEHGQIAGYIQYGIPSYLYNASGEKDPQLLGGVIRDLYFAPDSGCGEALIHTAHAFFDRNQLARRFAFFHAFGMICNAGHGKLHRDLPWIEQALLEAGYEKEHENVYYRRQLTGDDLLSRSDVSICFAPANAQGLCPFSVMLGDTSIGAGELVFLPQGGIAYLKWIWIDSARQGQGYGTAALRALFDSLSRQGFRRVDTDTADGNLIAQGLYRKAGFEDMGRTRSYLIPQ